jgi:hypothetical protein
MGLNGTRAGGKEMLAGTKKSLDIGLATGITDAAGTARDKETKKKGSDRAESTTTKQRATTAAIETGRARRDRGIASTAIAHR